MSSNPLWAPLTRAAFFAPLEQALGQGATGACLTGLVEGSRGLLLDLLVARGAGPFLLVVPDDAALEAYSRDLSAFATLLGHDPRRIVVLPALDADPYDGIAPHPEVCRERVVALDRLARGELDLLLVPVRALLQPLPTVERWKSWSRVIRRGDELAPDRFVLTAMGLGYRRVDIVGGPGEVSRRGGIVDVFPPTADQPVRVELFGDTVDSLRIFDTDNQRSTGQLDEVVMVPASENPPTDAALRQLADRLGAAIRDARDDQRTARELREKLEQLHSDGYWPGFELLAGLTCEESATLFDHARGLRLVVDEPERTEAELLRAAHDRDVTYEQGDNRWLPPPARLFGDPAAVRRRLEQASLVLQELSGEEPAGASSVWNVSSRSSRRYDGRIPELVEDLKKDAGRGVRTVCVMRAPGSAQRLREILGEYDLQAGSVDAAPVAGGDDVWKAGGLFLGVAGLRAGFELPELGLKVLAERDLFAEERKAADRKTQGRAAFVSDFRDLKEGAFVVHVDHGVARYTGLGRPKGGSLNRDFMVLEFAGGDRLFVPVDRLDLVQKYNGAGEAEPARDKLGGPGWSRVKARVRKSVESMARELLELYAKRKAAQGIAFSPDSEWQRELEAAFPYELTPDQARALEEIKESMEASRAMDRLLVGDVGYGKTEVAVRAAFKAVQDGYQVAILAPTTVLAAQHFKTFQERFAPFPVRVEMVSRFRPAAEIRKTLNELQTGAVDVLIGTHRLLSGDVEFHRLGLLVVDEEQRFGVKHKERLKQLSIGIEVLSMTATPIPRTLQMSLAGVRDLSVIETPPPGRMAIQTYLIPFRKNVLAQAIRQELRRGGQVFVVHNRIETLHSVARVVTEMCPEARVVMAHGRMPERKLEKVMLDFVEHRADVLITTTIIENGLDIPRANTIIVNRADRFGLAQLYQLRGRVGRSHQHAYAYMVVPSRHHLSEIARKRLRALQEFSDLGAGFRLAAADLEIRGAGELLGPKQHGHIAALGFDLYCQLLERAVQELKGEPVVERKPVGLHLGVDIKIPEHYLPEAGDRLVVYKRLAGARDAADVDRLQAETEDRFGRLPAAGEHLFDMGRLRVLAEQAGVKTIDLVEDTLQIRFHDRPPIEPAKVLEIIARERGTLKPSGIVLLPAPPRGADRIETVSSLLRSML
jgi:transcription-repair coupling factor (superfamily II helicase)